MNFKISTLLLFVLSPNFVLAQQDSVLSGSYEWKQPQINKNTINTSILLEGKVHDFEWMQISANTLSGKKNSRQFIPSNQEQLMIIKSGNCNLRIKDTIFHLSPGSVAVLMPGQKFSLKNSGNELCSFFAMKYRSKKPIDTQRNNKSIVKVWETIMYKPNNNGGSRRDFFEQPTPMQKRFEMHVTTLKEGLKSHEPHTHRAEEIVWMLEGDTEMQLGNGIVKTDIGGFYYLGSNVSHAIKNIGTKPATYFAFQFE
ncbi:cupin domain-containing protein [Ferruginibacter sp.]|nr:cupin domain-containing protein [Ferruginibacter sp.]